MFSYGQKQRLQYISDNYIESIHDLSLLSLAYPKPFQSFPVIYRPSWWHESIRLYGPDITTAIYLPGLSVVHHYVGCTFLEQFSCLTDYRRVVFARDCLVQVAKLLSRLDYYVHGDLTVANIRCRCVSGRYEFYVIDRCVFKRPQMCDLRMLYLSIMELFESPFPMLFDTFINVEMFDPNTFMKHMESI